MDNITGKGNWFEEVEEAILEEKKVVEKKKEILPSRDMKLITKFLEQVTIDYKNNSNKNLGDAIIHLECAIKSIHNGLG